MLTPTYSEAVALGYLLRNPKKFGLTEQVSMDSRSVTMKKMELRIGYKPTKYIILPNYIEFLRDILSDFCIFAAQIDRFKFERI